jgi:hypothetical protein
MALVHCHYYKTLASHSLARRHWHLPVITRVIVLLLCHSQQSCTHSSALAVQLLLVTDTVVVVTADSRLQCLTIVAVYGTPQVVTLLLVLVLLTD